MKTKQTIKISIPKPCSQNFGIMPDKEGGLYCGTCQTVVYDFSQMTDFELLSFFKTKPNVHCGRFHNSQLNRNIEPLKIKYPLLHKFSKIAASFFAILSLKTQQTKAQAVVITPSSQLSPKANINSNNINDSIVVKGNIKNEKNEYLQHAIVKFDGIATTKTDALGNYEFKLNSISENHNLYITCPNYVPVVRTYNPVMGSTVFDIVMGHRDSNAVEFYTDRTAGVIAPLFSEDIGFPTILFKKASLKISNDNRNILELIANKLKQNPYATIKFNAYQQSINDSKISSKRLALIVKFLIETKSISADRIITEVSYDLNKSELIEISSY